MRKDSSTQKRPASEANSFAIPASRSERSPASFRRAARRVSSRAASTWVAMSASLNWIAWCSEIGLPKVLRSWEYFSASSRALGDADAARGDVDAADLERVHHLREALVQPGLLATEDVLGGAAVAVEDQLGRL